MSSLRSAALALALLLPAAEGARAQEDLRVLGGGHGGVPADRLVGEALLEAAGELARRSAAALEEIDEPAELSAYQARMRGLFEERLGGFPERTPLSPRVTGVLLRDGFRIEKVLFESRPGFCVSAALYLPDSPPPHPAVLVPCGHSQNGKAAESYQRACILLARSGVAALCFDPIGQGERKQVLAADGTGRFRATEEHMVLGPACVLLGENLAAHMVWDGVRAIDYLCGREDVDPERIGCSGNSGGGTQTSYLMALDPRIRCAAPSCYLTDFQHLLAEIGPQDAEQNVFGQIAAGLDHAEYAILRAPRPTLICAATRDFFPIEGTRTTFGRARRFYDRLGFPERIDLVEADAEHGFSPALRVAMVGWMRRWLSGVEGEVVEPLDVPVASDAELQCTERGQVVLMEGARTVFDLHREEDERLLEVRRGLWAEGAPAELRERVRELAGIRPLDELPRLRARPAGAIEREGYRIEKLALEPRVEADRPEGAFVPLPALAFVPPRRAGAPVLYLHEGGKHADAAPGGPLEALALEGRLVLAVDLRGIGELQRRGARADYARHAGESWPDVLLAYLIGRSWLGMRAEEALMCADWLAERAGGDGGRVPVRLLAIGEPGPPALHAAALEPGLFASVELDRCLRSWSEVVETPVPSGQWAQVVHGALREYDLPQLASLIPSGRLRITRPVDAMGRELEPGVGR